MSQVDNDILMWSHYAEGHKGYCLKFNSNILRQHFFCKKVIYRNIYPKLREFTDEVSISNLLMSSKSNHWQYEKEYRFIVSPDNEVREFTFPAEALEGVIFGCNMKDINKDKILDLLNNSYFSNTKKYQAVKSRNTYSLKIESY